MILNSFINKRLPSPLAISTGQNRRGAEENYAKICENIGYIEDSRLKFR